MAKHNEIAYISNLNEHEVWHAVNKPFSDPNCGRYLVQLGTMISLLPPLPARLLDLGCGTGWTSQFFARAGYDVVGIDIAPAMIELAEESRDKAGLKNLMFKSSDYESLEFSNEFDCAVFFDSLHHADDEGLALRRVCAALKPGGVCVASEPGRGHHASENTRRAVERHGVNEKDMPPEHVIRLARQAGFRKFRVFPHAAELSRVVYTLRRDGVEEPFAAVDADPLPRRNRSFVTRVWGRVARVWRHEAHPPWRMGQIEHLLRYIRHSGLVLLQK